MNLAAEPGTVRDLNAGEVVFGRAPGVLRTLLGSCVAVTMWHPRRGLGGMCHFVVPVRYARRADALDGRYGKEAILLLIRHAVAADTAPGEYEFKVFGGGNMFAHQSRPAAADVGTLNVQCALALLQGVGHAVVARHVGQYGHRSLLFDLQSGEVWLRHHPLTA